MRTNTRMWKSLSIALLMFGLAIGALAGSAAAETLSISSPTKDPFYYVPGENVTVTYSGLSSSNAYDIEIESPNGTIVMSLYNQTSTTGSMTWSFIVPADFDGTYWVYGYVNGSGFPLNTRTFTVALFRLVAIVDHSVYLPGDSVTVYYYTQRYEDQDPLASGHGQWRLQVRRDNGTGPDIIDTLGGSISDPQGKIAISLPQSTRSDAYTLEVTYNDTSDAHSDIEYLTVRVGTFTLDIGLDRGTYASGDSVVVTVTTTTTYSFYSEPTSGVAITTKVETYDRPNALWVVNSSYSVPAQTTGLQGTVSFVITLLQGIADDTEFRVTVSANKGGATPEASDLFTVRAATAISIDLTLDKTTYRPGDQITATLSFVTSNASLVSGSMYRWTFTDDNTGAVLLRDYSAGDSTGAKKTYTIPAGFSGDIAVQVTVYAPDDRTYSRTEYASVFSWALLINPSKSYYSPGDSIKVDVTLVSNAISGATFIWTVTPNSGGDAVRNGTFTPGGNSGNFTFTIPDPADDGYTITVTASGTGQVVRDYAYISREKYVALQIDIPDKSFKPGDTVTVHYEFVAVGGATLPTTATISVFLSGGFGTMPGSSRTYEVGAIEGDLTYTIPASAPADADLMLTASSSGYGATGTSVFMRPSGGAAPASAAASTATWGLVIAVLALFVAAIALMRKPRSPMGDRPSSFSEMKPESPKKDPTVESAKKDEPPKSL